MKRYTVEKIIDIFEESGLKMYDATLTGNYRVNNREGKRLTQLFKLFENDVEFGMQCIDRLLESENVVVKSTAAAYSLALNYNVNRAIIVLKEIAGDNKNGIFAFNADMTIKEWEKKGSLKIYQK